MRKEGRREGSGQLERLQRAGHVHLERGQFGTWNTKYVTRAGERRGWGCYSLGDHRAQGSHLGTSLVEQRLRICLLMQGTWVRALVWEDPTCRRATKPVCHNY